MPDKGSTIELHPYLSTTFTFSQGLAGTQAGVELTQQLKLYK